MMTVRRSVSSRRPSLRSARSCKRGKQRVKRPASTILNCVTCQEQAASQTKKLRSWWTSSHIPWSVGVDGNSNLTLSWPDLTFGWPERRKSLAGTDSLGMHLFFPAPVKTGSLTLASSLFMSLHPVDYAVDTLKQFPNSGSSALSRSPAIPRLELWSRRQNPR